MAASLDTKFEKGLSTGSAVTSFSFVSNAGTVSGTVGNNNRVLIGFLASNQSIAQLGTVGMTWDGVALTAITSRSNGATGSVWLLGLIAPNIGNKTLAATFNNSSGTFYLGAICVQEADQTTGWQNSGTDTGSGSPASSAVTSASGNFAIAGHDNDNGGSTAISAGTSAWIDTANDTNAAMGYVASSGSTSTITWTYTGSHAWGNVKVDVIAVGAGGGGRTSKNTRTNPLGMNLGMNLWGTRPAGYGQHASGLYVPERVAA